jgi:hypothetical protein
MAAMVMASPKTTPKLRIEKLGRPAHTNKHKHAHSALVMWEGRCRTVGRAGEGG